MKPTASAKGKANAPVKFMVMEQTQTFREYGVEVVRRYLRDMLSHVAGVRAGEDIEAVHDIRVASRRLRAALSVFGAAFQGPPFRAFEREVKRVTDAFSAARDLDVMIDALEKLDAEIPAANRRGVDSFIDELRRKRARMQCQVVKSLDRMERQNLEARFEALLPVKLFVPGEHENEDEDEDEHDLAATRVGA